MTREEILKMEAGEELDKPIIKELMHHIWDDGERPRCKICGAWQDYNRPIGCEGRKYSTDISAAWRVVEKLRSMEDDKGNALLCCLTIYSDHDLCWDIKWCFSELSTKNDGHQTHRLPTCYDNFPEAICKAALLIKYS